MLNSSHALPLSNNVTGPVSASSFELFLLEEGQGHGKTCSTVDDAGKTNGAVRIADEEFVLQLRGASSFFYTPTLDLIVVILRPGQATCELDVLVQDTKISYLAGSITLAQMCSRVHALCKVQRECISSLCKPGRRGLSVAEASCYSLQFICCFVPSFRICENVTYVQVCRDMLAKSIKRLFCFVFYYLGVRLP